LLRAYNLTRLPQTGETFELEISVVNDVAELLLNTSGEGLFKRGYRDLSTEAPIKETLASALIDLARVNGQNFCDPFAGSGTLAIEYARVVKNIAPGIDRDFAFERFGLPEACRALERVKEEARAKERKTDRLIIASDINPNLVSIIARHARRARVQDAIRVQTCDATKIVLPKEAGVVVTNPPYGERLMTEAEVGVLYRDFSTNMRKNNPDWRVNVVTAYENFERAYGKRATKNRKIYNARLSCRFYMF
jgi:putative N6-adenine-specific DNA methylase